MGDFITLILIALKYCIYMADGQISLISVLIILQYACITFQKLDIARGETQTTGVDKGVTTDLHQCL